MISSITSGIENSFELTIEHKINDKTPERYKKQLKKIRIKIKTVGWDNYRLEYRRNNIPLPK